MKSSQRMLAFFGAMLITFGVSGLDIEQLSWKGNEVNYVAMTVGIVFSVIFFINKFREA